MSDEPALRPPAMRDRRSPITRPYPSRPDGTAHRPGPHPGLHGRVAVEIGADRQGAREQKRRVDRGKLTLPDTTTRFDVQAKTGAKSPVPGGIRFGTLRAVDQVTESFSGDLGREIAEEDTAFDDNWNRRQCHTDGGDAGGSIRVSSRHVPAHCPGWFHGNRTGPWRRYRLNISVGQRSSEVGIGPGHVSHESVDRFTQLHADAAGFSVLSVRCHR